MKQNIVLISISMFFIFSCTSLHEVKGNSKQYCSSGYIDVRGEKQYLDIKTQNVDFPIILFLHGGPGAARMPLNKLYLNNLSKDFIVVNWDQRGAGKSYHGAISENYQSIDSFVEDGKEVTDYLLKKFKKNKIYIVGSSWGSLLGMELIYKYPQLYYAFIGTGQVVDMKENFKVSYDLLLKESVEKNYYLRKFILRKIGRPKLDGSKNDHTEMYFQYLINFTRHSNTTFIEPQFRGVLTMLTFAYNPFLEILKTNGYKKLWEEILNIDLRKDIKKVEVPVYFAIGRQDFHTPYSLVEEYFNMLVAPKKELTWFEKSAHGVAYDEPKKFTELLKRVQKETLDK